MTKLFTKNTPAWQDEILAAAERYNITEDGGAAFKATMQIVLSTAVVQAGTAVDAARMNNIENGLDTVDTRASALNDLVMTLLNGWIADSDPWVYASPNSFKIIGKNVISRFAVGSKLSCTNTGQKYAYAIAAAMSGSDTLVTTAGDALVAGAITAPAYSYAANPQGGFTHWFAWVPTIVGFSILPTGLVHRFCIQGRTCTVMHYGNPVGTSNGTTYTVSLPVTSAAVAAPSYTKTGFAYNASAPTEGVVLISSNSAIATLYPTGALGAWTASIGKAAAFTASYEI